MKLRTHYTYFLPILLMQIISGIAFPFILTLEDYGLLTIYLTTITFFTFTSLGSNIGFSLMNRERKFNEVSSTRNTLIFYIIIQILIEIVVFGIQLLMKVDTIYYYIGISILSMSLYDYVRYYYLTFNFAHRVNLMTLVLRVLILVEIPVYIKTGSLESVIIVDMFIRTLISVIGVVDVFIKAPKVENSFTKDSIESIKQVKLGFPVMVASLLFTSSLMFDKYGLAKDLSALAIYSFAIYIVLIIRMLLKPLNDVLFVQIERELSSTQYEALVKKTMYITFPLIFIISIIAEWSLNNLEALEKYSTSSDLIPILALMIPLMIPLESILFNLNKLGNLKNLLLKVSLTTILVISILFTYTNNIEILNLEFYSLIVVLVYFSNYIIFSVKIIEKKTIITTSLMYIIFSVVYLLLQTLIIKA